MLCYAKLLKVMCTYELSLHTYTYIAYFTYESILYIIQAFNQRELKTETLATVLTDPICGHVTILDQENLCT